MAAVFLVTLSTDLDVAETLELQRSSSDLLFLWSENDIPARVQLRLTRMGYTNIQIFGVMADSKAEVRTMITDEIVDSAEVGLTPVQKSEAKLIANQILSAWITASLRSIEEVRLSTDSKLLRLPSMLSRPTLIALRQKFEAAHGRVPDGLWPCASLIEKRLEEVEEGSCSAQSLTEIISIEDAGDEFTTIQEAGSSVKVRKSPKQIPLPGTTEELRNRFKTLAISFTLAGYRHSNRLWIRTSTMQVWLEYVEYLLSDKIAAYHLDQEGISIKASWATVLNYDLNMRKLACRKFLYDSLDFEAALNFAKTDLSCKEQYFITPTALLSSTRRHGSNVSSTSSAAMHSRVTPPASVKGRGKGNGGISNKKRKAEARTQWFVDNPTTAAVKGKGKKGGKGKGKANLKKTPDGRLICGFHNSLVGCSRSPCNYVHVCSNCFGTDHIAPACSAA